MSDELGTSWQEIQTQLDIFDSTGIWPNGKVPEWAAKAAERLHCHTGSQAVVEIGLRQIIAQLTAKPSSPAAVPAQPGAVERELAEELGLTIRDGQWIRPVDDGTPTVGIVVDPKVRAALVKERRERKLISESVGKLSMALGNPCVEFPAGAPEVGVINYATKRFRKLSEEGTQ